MQETFLDAGAGGVFKLQLQWVPSRENEADSITRESVDDDIRLHAKVFQEILSRWGGVFRDLMASSGNVQCNKRGESLPFIPNMKIFRRWGRTSLHKIS